MILYVVYDVHSCRVVLFFFFFFKQKTAYEMRISDWSSDVCSSDLKGFPGSDHHHSPCPRAAPWVWRRGSPSAVRQRCNQKPRRRSGWPRVLSLTMEAIWIIKSPAPITLGVTRPAGLFTLCLPNIGRCRTRYARVAHAR